MPTLNERNYLRAMQPLRMYPSRVTVAPRERVSIQTVDFRAMPGITVISDVPRWNEYWARIRGVDDSAHSFTWDASGNRWNTIFEDVLKFTRAQTAKYRELHRKLAELRRLQKGWDSYGAEPPSAKACALAESILDVLQRHAFPVEFLTATSDGSILLKHRAGIAAITWEIDDDGEIGVMVERSGTNPEYHSPQEGQIASLVTKLALHG